MGHPEGFLNIKRKKGGYRAISERTKDYAEVEQTLNLEDRKQQAARCMDCGTPFCHWACPVSNIMPEWQDLLYKGKIEEAYKLLTKTNNFPEFTGRVCPALCEASCVLGHIDEPVTIRENEVSIAEKAFEMGFVTPTPPQKRTKHTVAVIGSGPAGLAAADLLNQAGHNVTVFEKDEKAGGLLRYGIPDFKIHKAVIDRRLEVLEKEGIKFIYNTNVGVDITAEDLTKKYDAICLTIGAQQPRDLTVDGRELKGVYFAMDFLTQQNKVNYGTEIPKGKRITAKGKNVVVIGGGDTGADCVGTSIRQGAKSVTQIEIMPKPPVERNANNPWPYWPTTLRTSTSHEEGCDRMWSLATQEFVGKDGKLTGVEVADVEWSNTNGKHSMEIVKDSEKVLDADIVFLAMGFVHPIQEGLLKSLGVKFDPRGNVLVDSKYKSSIDKVFAAGDAQTGASLVVKAIDHGRKAAESIIEYLK